MNPAKTTEPTKMPIGGQTRVAEPLDGDWDPHGKREFCDLLDSERWMCLIEKHWKSVLRQFTQQKNQSRRQRRLRAADCNAPDCLVSHVDIAPAKNPPLLRCGFSSKFVDHSFRYFIAPCFIFTKRRYDSAVCAVTLQLSVRLSVRPSACHKPVLYRIVPKRLTRKQ